MFFYYIIYCLFVIVILLMYVIRKIFRSFTLPKYILSELFIIEIFKIKKTQPSALFGATNYENRISTYVNNYFFHLENK